MNCPVCSKKLISDRTTFSGRHCVLCENCGVQGPEAKSEKNAWKGFRRLTGQKAEVKVKTSKGPDLEKFELVAHSDGCPPLGEGEECAAFVQNKNEGKKYCVYGNMGKGPCGAGRNQRYRLRTTAKTPNAPYHFFVNDPAEIDFDQIDRESGEDSEIMVTIGGPNIRVEVTPK